MIADPSWIHSIFTFPSFVRPQAGHPTFSPLCGVFHHHRNHILWKVIHLIKNTQMCYIFKKLVFFMDIDYLKWHSCGESNRKCILYTPTVFERPKLCIISGKQEVCNLSPQSTGPPVKWSPLQIEFAQLALSSCIYIVCKKTIQKYHEFFHPPPGRASLQYLSYILRHLPKSHHHKAKSSNRSSCSI